MARRRRNRMAGQAIGKPSRGKPARGTKPAPQGKPPARNTKPAPQGKPNRGGARPAFQGKPNRGPVATTYPSGGVKPSVVQPAVNRPNRGPQPGPQGKPNRGPQVRTQPSRNTKPAPQGKPNRGPVATTYPSGGVKPSVVQPAGNKPNRGGGKPAVNRPTPNWNKVTPAVQEKPKPAQPQHQKLKDGKNKGGSGRPVRPNRPPVSRPEPKPVVDPAPTATTYPSGGVKPTEVGPAEENTTNNTTNTTNNSTTNNSTTNNSTYEINVGSSYRAPQMAQQTYGGMRNRNQGGSGGNSFFNFRDQIQFGK